MKSLSLGHCHFSHRYMKGYAETRLFYVLVASLNTSKYSGLCIVYDLLTFV